MKPALARCKEQALLTQPLSEVSTAPTRDLASFDTANYLSTAKPPKLQSTQACPLKGFGGFGRGANITIASIGLLMAPQLGGTASDVEMLADANVLWLGRTTQPTGAECTPWSHAREACSSRPLDRQVHERLLTVPVADLSRDALAMLSINKSQMAGILGIERPHFYQWLKGSVTQPHKAGRLRDLLALLERSGITHRDPLRLHLLTEPLEPAATPLLAQLGKDLKSPLLAAVLLRAAELNRTITTEAEQRTEKMKAAGHVAPLDDEAQATFDQTVTMMEWDNA